MTQSFFFILFILFVIAILGLDLVLQRRGREMSFRGALAWSAVWIGAAAGFAVMLYFWQDRRAALEFTTAYVIELSLSVDNLFIFLLVFRHFQVPSRDQHKVLFWGIAGAVVMRGVFIFAGVGLLREFEWLMYVFGAILVYSGIRFATKGKAEVDPDKSWMLNIFRRLFPVTEHFEGDKFFVRREGLYATPLLLVLVLIETTDVLFATDSIPAVLAITLNIVVIFTSNIFAILGLRSMYFALAGLVDMFRYLHYGLAAVLMFIGAKMLAAHYHPISTVIALATVGSILFASVIVSVAQKRRTL